MKIKLIIWDLDDTLWKGTLAEKEDLILFSHRIEMIKKLNQHGIVNSICSKNDFENTKKYLQSIELWDEFIFPKISFKPKGNIIKHLIKSIQLKPENILFVDDNISNLQEVKYINPKINILDANTSKCDEILYKIISDNSHIKKSRVNDYKQMEIRQLDEEENFLSREDFLYASQIKCSISWRVDNLEFIDRIVELINRTNQLNFLKTRVVKDELKDLILNNNLYDCASLFAWDKYGYYGLVGFAALDRKTRKLIHLTFSCRIMHMGMESFLLDNIKKLYSNVDLSEIPVSIAPTGWISLDLFNNPEVRDFIIRMETGKLSSNVNVRIMANCQSASIAHYSQLGDIVDYDNWPRAFSMQQVITDLHLRQKFPKIIFYGVFNDYSYQYWSEENQSKLKSGLYEDCAIKFISYLQTSVEALYILLPPLNIPQSKFRDDLGVSNERTAYLNSFWNNLSHSYDFIKIIDLDSILDDNDIIDVRHFNVTGLKKIGSYVGNLVNENYSF